MSDKKSCSADARVVRELAKTYEGLHWRRPRPCGWCGSTMKITAPRQKYCTRCRRAATQHEHQLYLKHRSPRRPDPETARATRCETCGERYEWRTNAIGAVLEYCGCGMRPITMEAYCGRD